MTEHTDDSRRRSDNEIYEMLGGIKQFMADSIRAREEEKASLAKWRESSAIEVRELREELAGLRSEVTSLKNKIHDLTAPARWAIGIAALITTVGAVAAFGKRFLIFIRDALT